MGEDQELPFQLSFNRLLRVGFQGWKVTSNGGLIQVRELDERLGFGDLVEEHLADFQASNARFSFPDLLRQWVYSATAPGPDLSADRASESLGLRGGCLPACWDGSMDCRFHQDSRGYWAP